MFVSGGYRNPALVRARYTEHTRAAAVDTGRGSAHTSSGVVAGLPAPRGLQATMLPSGSVYLSWGASAPGWITYQVRRGDVVTETTDLGIVVAGGDPGSEVVWSVRAVSGTLTSSASSIKVSFVVDEPVPVREDGPPALEA